MSHDAQSGRKRYNLAAPPGIVAVTSCAIFDETSRALNGIIPLPIGLPKRIHDNEHRTKDEPCNQAPRHPLSHVLSMKNAAPIILVAAVQTERGLVQTTSYIVKKPALLMGTNL